MPSLPTTEELVDMLVPTWTAALGIAATRDSDFIAIGGTSIAAASIANAVAQRYGDADGIELAAIQAVFTAPTLEAMAQDLAAFLREQTGPPTPDVNCSIRTDPQ